MSFNVGDRVRVTHYPAAADGGNDMVIGAVGTVKRLSNYVEVELDAPVDGSNWWLFEKEELQNEC